MQKRLEELLYSGRFFKNDFAVVLQPFLRYADPPRLPVIYFALKGQAQLYQAWLKCLLSGDESELEVCRVRIESSGSLVWQLLRMSGWQVHVSPTTHSSSVIYHVHVCLFVCFFDLWTGWEDWHDFLHSRLLPLHHKGTRGAGQGTVEQHGERCFTLIVVNEQFRRVYFV